jgi:hypothetical protein
MDAVKGDENAKLYWVSWKCRELVVDISSNPEIQLRACPSEEKCPILPRRL